MLGYRYADDCKHRQHRRLFWLSGVQFNESGLTEPENDDGEAENDFAPNRSSEARARWIRSRRKPNR